MTEDVSRVFPGSYGPLGPSVVILTMLDYIIFFFNPSVSIEGINLGLGRSPGEGNGNPL